MNRYFTLLLFILTFSSTLLAQDRPRWEQIKPMKVAFINTELQLSVEEAEKFWPIYNAYESKVYELRSKKLKDYIQRIGQNVDQMSDKEAETLLANIEKAEEEIVQLRKKLHADLKGILTPVKILKLKKVEEDFNRNLMRQYRGGRNQDRN
ncbi:MAG: sensor of ECF-type sigma factor [Flavobacterium sp.]